MEKKKSYLDQYLSYEMRLGVRYEVDWRGQGKIAMFVEYGPGGRCEIGLLLERGCAEIEQGWEFGFRKQL